MSHAKYMSHCVYHAMTNITSMHEACRTCRMKHVTNMNESVMLDIWINSTPPAAQMYCVYGVCESCGRGVGVPAVRCIGRAVAVTDTAWVWPNSFQPQQVIAPTLLQCIDNMAFIHRIHVHMSTHTRTHEYDYVKPSSYVPFVTANAIVVYTST